MKAVKLEKDAFGVTRIVLFDKVEFQVGTSWEWGFQATYYHLERTFTLQLIRWYLLITVYHNDLDPSEQK